ncbi:MAG TPA: RNA methyltransferase [Acidisarcina sp.]|nr:RNA methyltransferase [Acidisarcina sp.]
MQTARNQTRIRIVQSRQNSRVKELRAALSRGPRSSQDPVALEGLHLVEEALRSGLKVTTVFLRQGSEPLLDTLPLASETEVLALPPEVFASALTTESPQGVAALALPPHFDPQDLFRRQPLILVAAGLQDPGNMGTLLRSAEAFGATGILALPGTVSQWNPKALRASSGSAFRLPVFAMGEGDAVALLRQHRLLLLATTVNGGTPLREMNLNQPCALLIGNEGGGLSQSLLEKADAAVTIPCDGPVESLNAAVAASIVLYEASRQRSLLSTALASRELTRP